MAQEAERGCGHRKVGGMYLCGGGISVACDRLPYPVGSCPVCGMGIHFTRAFTEINPLKLFGIHEDCTEINQGCFMCQPQDEVAYLMVVGAKWYTPQSFMDEAMNMGISKRIAHKPKKLVLGKTIVYLVHPQAVIERPVIADEGETVKDVLAKVEFYMGIFTAFIPRRIEKLIWQSEATPEELEALTKRGISPVVISDGDPDHA